MRPGKCIFINSIELGNNTKEVYLTKVLKEYIHKDFSFYDIRYWFELKSQQFELGAKISYLFGKK